MKRKLVIVESPAKARTLGKILGKDYDLKATLGHIRDLPKSQLGVDIERGFTPKYVLIRNRSKLVRELKQAVKTVDMVYLATDPDREGEAIAWHLMEVTKSGKTAYRRVIFHEITGEAIRRAFKAPRFIDIQLVNAQQARRILDRLVGYKLSPLLWRKVRRGLSAGRVQSVAVRIIVDREREIDNFIPEEYWTIEAELAKKPAARRVPFRALLVGFIGAKLVIHNQQEADEIRQELEQSSYRVLKVKTKKVSRQPPPPFITSTLQQEAWRKLRFSAKQTMAVAQQLYEGLPVGDEGNIGLITYMRTDSTRVARQAIAEAREFITQRYGAQFIPSHARSFVSRLKRAQEAHEAIRPTKVWRQPSLIKPYLNADQSRLYRLIWQRMVASQMAAAIFDSTTVDIEAKHSPSKTRYLFRASSLVNIFPGFIVLYTEGKDEEEKKGRPLPPLAKGDELELLDLFPEQHFTQPPPRFTEATLIKALEHWGIGRPSTYAPILATIQEREYVAKANGNFKPTELGMVVNDLLVKHFGDIVDVAFSAHMEDELDKIANEDRDWVQVVKGFYTPFEKDLEKAAQSMERIKLAVEEVAETCPKCGHPLVVKTGRFGKFLACPKYPDCKFTKPYLIKVGVKCPEAGCGGEIVEKRSKKGKVFYGCSNYPKCRFAVFNRPLRQSCPNCGGLLTVYRLKWARCAKCEYRGKLKQD